MSLIVTTRVAEIGIAHNMPEKYPERRRSVVSIDQFEERFRRTFGRDMTTEERRFLRLTMEMIEEDNDDMNEAAAGA